LIAVGVFQLGAYFALAHKAVVWVPAGRTAILANATTMWVLPLSLIFLHERIAPRRWMATGLGLAGVVVLMSPWSIDWTTRNVLIGHAFLLGAALSWSVAIIVTRAARPHLSMFGLLPWCFAVGAVMLAPILIWHATATLPTIVSSVGFLMTPAVSLVLANRFLGAAFTSDLLSGAALIIGGVGAGAWPGAKK
jgi:O-acetylserine/cysteine efflux transporter